jgi:CRISPR type IV-associated protein Csf3
MAWRSTYQPLHVRAYLRTAVVSDRWLPLDGVLCYTAARQTLGVQQSTTPGASTPGAVRTVRVPIGMDHSGTPHWYYRCSWAQWPAHTIEGQDHWNKRFRSGLAELIDFRGRRGMVITKQDQYKAYHMPVYYRAALWLDWYCVGDERDIRSLLSVVTHLGKKTVQGWGRVAHWEVERAAVDCSVWQGDKLMRGIPAHLAPGQHPVALYGVRPGYWRRENQMMLALPT